MAQAAQVGIELMTEITHKQAHCTHERTMSFEYHDVIDILRGEYCRDCLLVNTGGDWQQMSSAMKLPLAVMELKLAIGEELQPVAESFDRVIRSTARAMENFSKQVRSRGMMIQVSTGEDQPSLFRRLYRMVRSE